jgi:hypothetical protein
MSVDTDSWDGTCDVWDEDVRRARKDRACDACRETIRRGELYHSTRSLYDGRWETTSRCARCQSMVAFLSAALPRGEVCARELDCGHDWEENFKLPPPPEVAALAFLTAAEAQALLEKGNAAKFTELGSAFRLTAQFRAVSHRWLRSTPESRATRRFHGHGALLCWT